MQIALSKPDIGEQEIKLVNEVLSSTYLALGQKMVKFEGMVARFVGRRFAVAVNSGTSGLHLAIRAFSFGEGDEIITTPFSFIASSNAILYERAAPVFVDVEEKTGNIDSNLIQAAINSRTRAILPVDVFGQPAKLDRIRALADNHGLAVIEDSCEALGSQWNSISAGSGRWAEAAVFAFYPNKQITTGEGGMIVTDDDKIAALCRSMRNQGRREEGAKQDDGAGKNGNCDEGLPGGLWLSHERLGYNYRMDELSAALGVAQMSRIEELLAKREKVAALYNERLRGIEGLRLPYIAPEVTRMSWFVYVIQVGWHEKNSKRQAEVRAQVMRQLFAAGIQCRPYFTPIHLQPFYRSRFGFRGGEFPCAEKLGRTSIAIPFYNQLTEDEIDYIGKALRQAYSSALASGAFG
ncbi:MAG: DegT/DnrJ/EryC1/StrS family aminotransferase [Elusimicrobia bacterium]|nr:DegT/DnrJ/EryC1/StrS family aminotransferase [Elusimicrobiota bacterium]